MFEALSYHGINISQAAAQGNLPICVLLWGMAAAKRVNLMQSDDIGCNPMHYAAMADNPEVLGFINQQTRGLLTPSDLKLIDSRNLSGETPLLRSMYTGRMSVVKTLLDDGSDPFIRDNNGNTIIILFWLFKDPGVIDTRQFDFNEIMEQSYRIGGAPPSSQVCRTTLIKKPLRSKYCSQLGVVIARMDHHCVWLNNSIGYKNHRLFMIFLYCHSTAMVLKSTLLIRLLNRQFLNSSTLFASLGLLALTIEQTYNICHNITTNERINGNRYNWLIDDNGNQYNRFNRGILKNILEFCQIPYYNDQI
eukprot:gene19949-25915_t